MDIDYDALVATAKFYEPGAGSPVQKAARLTTAKFAKGFPGWQIHWRLCSGYEHFDRSIESYFIGLAHRLARAQKRNGFSYIGENKRGNEWLNQAARDAMAYVLYGKHAVALNDRAAQFGVAYKTYQKIRDPIALGMRFGMEKWTSEFNYQLSKIYFDLKIHTAENDLIIDGPQDFSDRQMKPDPAESASTATIVAT